MITHATAARLKEAMSGGFDWHREAAADERLKLGRRHKRWLSLTWLAQEGRPVPSHLQGARRPNEKTLVVMSRLGLIHEPDDTPIPWPRKNLHVTRDGEAAVTWWSEVWAPMSCAPTWGLPILCAIPGNDTWPDRFYAMRAERRGDEIVWITPNAGTAFYDKWTDGVWRAIP